MATPRIARRSLIASAAAVAGCGELWPTPLLSAPLLLQAKCGSANVPGTHSLALRATDMFAAIERETDGAVKTQFFPNDTLGNNDSQLTQLRTGAIQFMLGTGAGMGGLKPVCTIEEVGFAFKDYSEAFRAYDGGLGRRMRTEYGTIGLAAIGNFWAGGFNHIINAVRPIRMPADLAGLKIRVTTIPMLLDMFSTLGASPVPIPGPEAYTALQTHVADGMQSSLEIFEGQHFYEIQKYLSLTGHNLTLYILLINGDVWRGLPDSIKAVIQRNADKFALQQRSEEAAAERDLIAKLTSQGMVTNTPDKAPFRAKLGPYYGRMKNTFGADVWALLEATVGKLA